MKLTPVFIDAETFWDTDHTLSKMSPTEYVMSPKTEIISMAIKVRDYPTDVFFGEARIRKALHALDWSTKMAIGHNMSGFDAMILKWRFGIQPAMWGCTAAMARSRYAKTCGVSLTKLVQELGVGEKKDAILHSTKGRYLKDFTPQEIEAMKTYNREDTEQCAALFRKLVKGFPRDELMLIHLTTQMLVNPKFVLDKSLVEAALSVERDQKHKALLELAKLLRADADAPVGLDWSDEDAVAEFVRSEMASAARFSKLLESCQVEVPMKPSPTNPLKTTPALAKTDDEFIKLQDHRHPIVSAAARVRLSVKSTLLETRLQAFLRAADACNGRLPVPLKYAGADTTGRWSGEQYNMQNLPRIGSKPKTSDALRNSLKAPPGHKVVVADLSGIELRVNHFLWKVEESMELYQQDAEADLYRAFAAARYGITPDEVTKDQRQLAKLCLAEGTLVLTQRGEVPIEQVTASDKVWDGVEWVSTLGAVYKGVKHVIEYDGLTATPGHEVWVEDGRKVPLGYAAAQSLRLARTGDSGVPLGFGGAGVERSASGQGVPAGAGAVYELPDGEVGVVRQLAGGEDAGLSVMSPEVRGARLAAATAGSGASTLHEPERSRVQTLWGERCSVSVPERSAGGGVGGEQPWVAQGQGAGSDRQQRSLRAGQPTVGDAAAEHRQSRSGQVEGVSPVSVNAPGSPLRRQHSEEPAAQGAVVRSDSGEVEPPVRQAERRVWDLLNCGPRHRFTANGRLVSNCQLGLGFGAGAATFRKVAKLMGGLELSEEEAIEVVESWRATYHRIATGWRTCHAALSDIRQGIETPIDPWGMCVTEHEAIRLPSGRRIHYPSLRQERDDKGKTEWWYGEGRHKARIYAGKIDENIVQALARDVIAGNAVSFYKQTKLEPVLMVHDELAFIVPEAEADDVLNELQAVMRTPPTWWPELITWSEGDVANTYGAAK